MSYGDPTREQIAAVRHRFFVKPNPPYTDPPQRELRPLNAAQQARVAENRALVHQHLPEALPFIKELHEAGMIDGWRGVVAVNVDGIDTSAGCVEKTGEN